MNGILRNALLAGCTVFLAGCLSPKYTRLPTLRPSDVESERQALTYHDPNPDRDMGPPIDRPRGFDRPRAEPRRILEHQAITNQILRDGGEETDNNPSASRYPGSVNP